jgi:glycosyltransferase involved in cell wall biosynthesis
MKIAQVAPLYESVPPKLYGGTERVVHYLTQELVRQGHQVTLFASGDSQTNADLVWHIEEALRLNPHTVDPIANHIVQLQQVFERIDEFDIVHFHTDYIHFPFTENISVPHATTLHGRLDLPDLQYVYNKFPRQPVISVSDNQRKPLPQANFVGTVHHGLPANLHKPGKADGNYLAFLGRISPEKGLPRAIEIAKAAEMKLKIAAKIDKADMEYYEREIKPLLDNPLIEFIGEINEQQKCDFLGSARAFLFTIDWSEPFGMVIIEAMACGTPVIAHGMGSVPEIIQNGENGFITDNVKEAVSIIKNLDSFDRKKVRKIFDERFTAERMAKDYVRIYENLIRKKYLQKSLKMPDHKTIPINKDIISSKVVG